MAGKDDGNQYVTVSNAAQLAGIPERTLRHWINSGKLSATGGKRGRLVRLAEVQELATLTGRDSARDEAATATATSAEPAAGNDADGNTEEPVAGNDPGNTAIIADAARQQMETFRDGLLAPLIEHNARLVERIGELEREAGRLESERDALQSQLDARGSTESDETAEDEPQGDVYVYRLPAEDKRRWWQRWKGRS